MVEHSFNINVVLLHKHPEFLDACCEFVNKQWKRSTSARYQSLEKSYKELPDSLILVDIRKAEENIIGHSRVTRVLEDSDGCWIGSVLISEEKRGQGFGKYLMQKTEDYAKLLGFTVAYINTKDQEGFYEHIGYSYCEAVSSVSFKADNLKMRTNFNLFKTAKSCKCDIITASNGEGMLAPNNNNSSQIPAPPPLPDIRTAHQAPINTNLGQFWMKKIL